jgi:Tfp pilus assembly protein PilO
MGVLVPLFKPKVPPEELPLSPEQRLRLKLIHNSMEALRREEKSVESTITQKCREEIDRLNAIDSQMRQLEQELEALVRQNKPRTTCPRR